MTEILAIRELWLSFHGAAGPVPVLRGLTFAIGRGERVALVGRSGSGKSVTGRAVLGLAGPAAEITAGSLCLDGQELRGIAERGLRRIRGQRVAMVFQDARAALNPIRRIGDTLADIVLAHDASGLRRGAARRRAIALLEQVGIDRPQIRARAYPAELSGGMCQRIGIAAALACAPDLVIADEPTSALDPVAQARVMAMLTGATRDRGAALLFITHDLALAAAHCDRALVMADGRIVEDGPAARVFASPRSAKTRALLAALPGGAST